MGSSQSGCARERDFANSVEDSAQAGRTLDGGGEEDDEDGRNEGPFGGHNSHDIGPLSSVWVGELKGAALQVCGRVGGC